MDLRERIARAVQGGLYKGDDFPGWDHEIPIILMQCFDVADAVLAVLGQPFHCDECAIDVVISHDPSETPFLSGETVWCPRCLDRSLGWLDVAATTPQERTT